MDEEAAPVSMTPEEYRWVLGLYDCALAKEPRVLGAFQAAFERWAEMPGTLEFEPDGLATALVYVMDLADHEAFRIERGSIATESFLRRLRDEIRVLPNVGAHILRDRAAKLGIADDQDTLCTMLISGFSEYTRSKNAQMDHIIARSEGSGS